MQHASFIAALLFKAKQFSLIARWFPTKAQRLLTVRPGSCCPSAVRTFSLTGAAKLKSVAEEKQTAVIFLTAGSAAEHQAATKHVGLSLVVEWRKKIALLHLLSLSLLHSPPTHEAQSWIQQFLPVSQMEEQEAETGKDQRNLSFRSFKSCDWGPYVQAHVQVYLFITFL